MILLFDISRLLTKIKSASENTVYFLERNWCGIHDSIVHMQLCIVIHEINGQKLL
jgi:hypothetical protein